MNRWFHWIQKMTDIHHVGQFVQYLIDLLAVCEANVRLPHQTPHFLPDVIFVQLNKQKCPHGKKVKIFGGTKNMKFGIDQQHLGWLKWHKGLHTFNISMYAIMLCSKVARSLSSSSSRRLRSCSPNDRYLRSQTKHRKASINGPGPKLQTYLDKVDATW